MIPQIRHSSGRYQRETLPFLGLNRSDNTQEGEFSHQTNISGRRYPYLAPRLPRRKTVYDDVPTALFAWDGKEIMVSGGQLLYDGKALCNVTSGEKQFAVVNTSLIVHPDMIMVDLTKGTASDMSKSVSNGGTATFSGNALTFQPTTLYATSSQGYRSTTAYGMWVWTYSSVSWTASGGWVLNGPALYTIFDDRIDGRIFIPTATYSADTGRYALGVPDGEWDNTGQPYYPEPAPANNLGFYGVITRDTTDTDQYQGLDGSRAAWIFTYYAESLKNSIKLSDHFSVGEYIDISNSGVAKNDREKAKITEITADTVTIAGAEFTNTSTTRAVTISKSMPGKLDFICESGNRLWGLASETKTIYASALGEPMEFFDYSGVDTDSWTVAVGTEGDFTGLCAYGDAVLCWKERVLHKILGKLPSEFSMSTFRFSGVKAGAYKSLVNVNETLFYLSTDGVCAYGGNVPSIVSRALGADVLSAGVGGTDGRNYYLSAMNAVGAWEMLAYDTETGLWMREDDTRAVDFCRIGDAVKFLGEDAVYQLNAADGDAVEWEGVLTPFYETLQGRKHYSKLILRIEVPVGGYIAADVRFDGGRWMQMGLVTGEHVGTKLLPVPIRRCDKFEIRIRGKGNGAVLDVLREFKLRGDDR